MQPLIVRQSWRIWGKLLYKSVKFYFVYTYLLCINKITVAISCKRNRIGTKIGIFGDSSVFTFHLIPFLALGRTQSVSRR